MPLLESMHLDLYQETKFSESCSSGAERGGGTKMESGGRTFSVMTEENSTILFMVNCYAINCFTHKCFPNRCLAQALLMIPDILDLHQCGPDTRMQICSRLKREMLVLCT